MAAWADDIGILASIRRDRVGQNAHNPCKLQARSADETVGNTVNHWPFIIAAYALTALGTLGISLWSFRQMRRAEKKVDDL
jgi:Heme exporter protein D (CcmD)